jgi:hypothetical protein
MTATVPTEELLDRIPRASTLLALVQQLGRETDLSESELIETTAQLVNNGRVRLTGNFRGCTLDVSLRSSECERTGRAIPQGAPRDGT